MSYSLIVNAISNELLGRCVYITSHTLRDMHCTGNYLLFVSFGGVCVFHILEKKMVCEFRKPSQVGSEST